MNDRILQIKFEDDFDNVLTTLEEEYKFEQMVITEFANKLPGVFFKSGSVGKGI